MFVILVGEILKLYVIYVISDDWIYTSQLQ